MNDDEWLLSTFSYEQLQKNPLIQAAFTVERERIIALLDSEHSEYTYQHQENKGAYIDDCAACFAIALIKGENK